MLLVNAGYRDSDVLFGAHQLLRSDFCYCWSDSDSVKIRVTSSARSRSESLGVVRNHPESSGVVQSRPESIGVDRNQSRSESTVAVRCMFPKPNPVDSGRLRLLTTPNDAG